MIPPIYSPWEPGIWQQHLKDAFRDATALLQHLELSPLLAAQPASFATLVPQPFVTRMVKGDANDPLLRQVLPVSQEDEVHAAFVKDPLKETETYNRAPGLIHKYAGRALLITAPQCAVHCRYCFRRDFPYEAHRPKHLDTALDTLRSDTSIKEIILSGGDPMLLTDESWQELLQKLDAIPHLTRLRIHTRLPIVLPQRITAAWMEAAKESRLPCTLVVHANHANELDADTARAFSTLRAGGIHVLNQSVLLRAINNNADDQVALCERLYEQGVLPYYLHLPDAVQGTAHFHLDRVEAHEIYREMQSRLPGYLLPKLVQEVPGEANKVILV